MVLLLITQVSSPELNITYILITAIVSLAGAIIYLYKSKESMASKYEKRLDGLNDKILDVIDDHKEDLKENAKDSRKIVVDVNAILDRNTMMLEQLKNIVNELSR